MHNLLFVFLDISCHIYMCGREFNHFTNLGSFVNKIKFPIGMPQIK